MDPVSTASGLLTVIGAVLQTQVRIYDLLKANKKYEPLVKTLVLEAEVYAAILQDLGPKFSFSDTPKAVDSCLKLCSINNDNLETKIHNAATAKRLTNDMVQELREAVDGFRRSVSLLRDIIME